MDLFDQLSNLSTQMDIEPGEETNNLGVTQNHPRNDRGICTHAAMLPNGKTINLLKMQMSSACERNCNYCPFRAGRDFNRITLKPYEFSKLFIDLYRAGIVQGLFISSGLLNGGVKSQDKILEAAEILRNRAGYRGYLHLKLMPGLEKSQVEKAMHLANRVSINLEAPNPHRLEKLAPKKRFLEELIAPLRWVKEIKNDHLGYNGWNGHWPSTSTQFVIGAAEESDYELLTTSEDLLNEYGLKRIYYSAFKPFSDTPLESETPASPVRQHRLYQASFLIRDYGFSLNDLILDNGKNLPLESDPKLIWARRYLSDDPVEINIADKNELLHIPGIGIKSAEAIINARRIQKIKDLSSLMKIGIQPQRVSPFILLDGKRPIYQMTFW